jgi:hypothetical protein
MDEIINRMLRTRRQYVGISVPEELNIRIGFHEGRVLQDRTSTIIVGEFYIIKAKKNTVMLLFDGQNWPRVYSLPESDSEQLFHLMSLQ